MNFQFTLICQLHQGEVSQQGVAGRILGHRLEPPKVRQHCGTFLDYSKQIFTTY